MRTLDLLAAALPFLFLTYSKPLARNTQHLIRAYDGAPLQNIVTWDEHSLFIHGERTLLYSGEFHPFRLPVPGLWLDIFQKVKAIGYNCISFYTDWALLEGTRGTFRADGIFDLEPFFQAATDAGIYLIARPGPYINAEASGGGFPGWLQSVPGALRTIDPSYINATNLYMESIGKLIAAAEISKGGPIILVQPENEYTDVASGYKLSKKYMATVEGQLRAAGITVPFISNDAGPDGKFAPGTGVGSVDIYGHDGYPLGFDCANPSLWPDGALPTNWATLHSEQSPSTPYSIDEFQGGSFDPWGGTGFNRCAELLNAQFVRVFYKNLYSFRASILNIYMIYGGTNFGNLGQPGGYTSYDYGAAIAEDRTVIREKYSEQKLQANFLMASTAYLTATAQNNTNAAGAFTTSSAIAATQLTGNGSDTNFYVIRQASYNSFNKTTYKLKVSTSAGNFTIPQLGGALSLHGRDSKIHVTDYKLSSQNLLYCTAEIFTWTNSSGRIALVIYSGPNERHELAFSHATNATLIEGTGVKVQELNGSVILNFKTSPARRVVEIGEVFVYIVDRNSAYNYWTLNLENRQTLVAQAGYLLRNASLQGSTLKIVGDLNATKPLEIISGAPIGLKTLIFNGKPLKFTQNKNGVVKATLEYVAPKFTIPDLATLSWKYHDGLPEIQNSYNDSLWVSANKRHTSNDYRPLTTPTSLYGADYGFFPGSLLLRGHFTATGVETNLQITTQGGDAYGSSVWLNNQPIGHYSGNPNNYYYNDTYSFSTLQKGKKYVITVLIDDTGLDENYNVGDSTMKNPRGVMEYVLSGRNGTDIKWKITGNLGGENYIDLTRGPLNEGSMYPERQGWHQPNPPSSKWATRNPSQGISTAGVGFFSTSFDLDFPQGYDIPLSFVFDNATTSGNIPEYRVQLFVNGYQFGKYVNNIGPQTSFPVPEGILDHHGTNWVALTLWAQNQNGASISNFSLVSSGMVQTGYGHVVLAPTPAYVERPGAY